MRICEYCGKHRAIALFRNSGRFCSMACSKRYSVAFSKRVGKFKGDWDSGLLPELLPLALLAVQGVGAAMDRCSYFLCSFFFGGGGWVGRRWYSVAFSKHVGKFKGDWN